MPFGVGVDVEKGEVLLAFGDLVAGDLSLDDLGEYAAHFRGD